MADITKVIKFLVVGDVSKAQSGFKGLSKELKDTAKSGSGLKGLGRDLRDAVKSGQGMKGVGGVLKNATAEAGGLKGMVGKVGIGMAAMGAAAVAAGVAIAIKFGADSVATFKKVAGEVSKLKRVTGLTTEDASRLAFSFKQTGVDAEKGTKGMQILAKNLTNAADGGKKAAAMAKLLGTGFTDASGKVLPMSKLMPKLADRFASMPDGAKKTALAMKLFGKSGTDLLPFLNKGAAGMKELADKSDKFGNTLSDKQLDALKRSKAAQRDWDASMQGLQVTLGANLLPLLTQGAEMINQVAVPAFQGMAEWVHKNEGMFTALGNILRWVWNTILLPGIKLAVTGLTSLATPLALAIEGMGKLTGNKDLENFGAGMRNAITDTQRFVDGLQGIPDEVAPTITAKDQASSEVKKIDKRIKSLKGKVVEAKAKGNTKEVERLQREIRKLKNKKIDIEARVRQTGPRTISIRAIGGGKYKVGSTGSVFQAEGGIVRAFAGGGVENHAAKLYRRHDGMRIFNEPETRGEAYIPLANDWRRPRAVAIWRQTGRELGMFAGGGINGASAGGGGATINITVNGAVDPAGVGRQIVGYLKTYQRSTRGRVLPIKTQH